MVVTPANSTSEGKNNLSDVAVTPDEVEDWLPVLSEYFVTLPITDCQDAGKAENKFGNRDRRI